MSTRGVTNPSHLQAPAGPGAERRMAGRAPIQLIMGARLPLISTAPLPLIGGARPPPNLFPAIADYRYCRRKDYFTFFGDHVYTKL